MNRRAFTQSLVAVAGGLAAGIGSPSPARAAGEKAPKHVCKGRNECKGQGGCKSGDAGCAGKNSCKGKGGCSVPVNHAENGMAELRAAAAPSP